MSVLSKAFGARFGQARFAKNLTQGYVVNNAWSLELDKFIASAESELIVAGESGVGKSSLLSFWAEQHKSQHPEDIVVPHWTASSSRSACHVHMMHRIMRRVQQELGQSNANLPSSSDFTAVHDVFSRWSPRPHPTIIRHPSLTCTHIAMHG